MTSSVKNLLSFFILMLPFQGMAKDSHDSEEEGKISPLAIMIGLSCVIVAASALRSQSRQAAPQITNTSSNENISLKQISSLSNLKDELMGYVTNSRKNLELIAMKRNVEGGIHLSGEQRQLGDAVCAIVSQLHELDQLPKDNFDEKIQYLFEIKASIDRLGGGIVEADKKNMVEIKRHLNDIFLERVSRVGQEINGVEEQLKTQWSEIKKIPMLSVDQTDKQNDYNELLAGSALVALTRSSLDALNPTGNVNLELFHEIRRHSGIKNYEWSGEYHDQLEKLAKITTDAELTIDKLKAHVGNSKTAMGEYQAIYEQQNDEGQKAALSNWQFFFNQDTRHPVVLNGGLKGSQVHFLDVPVSLKGISELEDGDLVNPLEYTALSDLIEYCLGTTATKDFKQFLTPNCFKGLLLGCTELKGDNLIGLFFKSIRDLCDLDSHAEVPSSENREKNELAVMNGIRLIEYNRNRYLDKESNYGKCIDMGKNVYDKLEKLVGNFPEKSDSPPVQLTAELFLLLDYSLSSESEIFDEFLASDNLEAFFYNFMFLKNRKAQCKNSSNIILALSNKIAELVHGGRQSKNAIDPNSQVVSEQVRQLEYAVKKIIQLFSYQCKGFLAEDLDFDKCIKMNFDVYNLFNKFLVPEKSIYYHDDANLENFFRHELTAKLFDLFDALTDIKITDLEESWNGKNYHRIDLIDCPHFGLKLLNMNAEVLRYIIEDLKFDKSKVQMVLKKVNNKFRSGQIKYPQDKIRHLEYLTEILRQDALSQRNPKAFVAINDTIERGRQSDSDLTDLSHSETLFNCLKMQDHELELIINLHDYAYGKSVTSYTRDEVKRSLCTNLLRYLITGHNPVQSKDETDSKHKGSNSQESQEACAGSSGGGKPGKDNNAVSRKGFSEIVNDFMGEQEGVLSTSGILRRNKPSMLKGLLNRYLSQDRSLQEGEKRTGPGKESSGKAYNSYGNSNRLFTEVSERCEEPPFPSTSSKSDKSEDDPTKDNKSNSESSPSSMPSQ